MTKSVFLIFTYCRHDQIVRINLAPKRIDGEHATCLETWFIMFVVRLRRKTPMLCASFSSSFASTTSISWKFPFFPYYSFHVCIASMLNLSHNWRQLANYVDLGQSLISLCNTIYYQICEALWTMFEMTTWIRNFMNSLLEVLHFFLLKLTMWVAKLKNKNFLTSNGWWVLGKVDHLLQGVASWNLLQMCYVWVCGWKRFLIMSQP
jgi:hypothetical protein